MAYIAPIHRPSSVRHALRANLTADEESLVLAKANRLEIWGVGGDTLNLEYSTAINGTITILQKLRPKDYATDILFVGTERFEYFTLAWNPETRQLDDIIGETIKDPGELHMRNADSQERCIVDPTGRYLAMHVWEGVLTILRLGNRKNTILKLDWMAQVRLSELFITSSTFLYTENSYPKIAILYKTRSDAQDLKLATYRLTADDKHTEASKFEPKDRELDIDIVDCGSSLLIPVRKVQEAVKRHNVRNVDSAKAQVGGLIVLGETRLLYIDEVTKTTVESSLKQANIFVAWAEYDPTHYFLADDYGNMHLLTILTEPENNVVVKGMDVTKIGPPTSRASDLLYLGNGLLFVASHYGDSQLFKVDLAQEDTNKMMTLIQTMPNIGPILDFAIMDMGGRENNSALGNEYSSGQARIVTGSGAHKDGTLRSVRSGVGLEEIADLGAEFEDTRGLFALRSHGASKVDTLVASFLTETRVFRFDSQANVEELASFPGMDLGARTLVARNLLNGNILQVTTTSVSIIDAESGVVVSTWRPTGGGLILTAAENDQWLLVSVEGRRLVSLNLQEDLRLVMEKDVGDKDQIGCVHVAPQLPNIGVVGFWESGTVSILDMHTLEPIHGASFRKTQEDSIPRDIALVQVLPPSVSGPTLFVALEDGHVVTFRIGPDLSLSGMKSVVLGITQARFHLLPQADGIYNIFATTEHPSLIYGAEGRIVYSAVTAEDATVVCPFDAEAFPDSIVLATNSQIKISQIDRTRRTHARSLPMGETVRRITYSPAEKVFALGCVRRELTDGEEIIQSYFKLVDEVIFDRVGKEILLSTPSYTELVEAVIRAELPDSYGNPVERFIVGTSFLPDPDRGSTENVRGRILVFGIDSDRDPYLILSHELKGACRCLAVMDGGKIVAALTKTVVVSMYEEISTTKAHLTKLASFRPGTYPVDLAVNGNLIAVADLMKSLSLIEYVTPEGESPRLVETARHYQSAWATAVDHVDGESWLEADAHGNLMVLTRNPGGITLEDRRRLQITSEINLGEHVNRIRKVTVETSPNATVIPRAFLGTIEGSIYMFGTIAPKYQDLLLRFQAKLANYVKTLGRLEFNFRAFRNPERTGEAPDRFLDGELLERFLDFGDDLQAEICKGLGSSAETMRNMVEDLRRMH
ncbi:DNA damage-binding protein 1 [Naviculisporaceae sp. PSN 640]